MRRLQIFLLALFLLAFNLLRSQCVPGTDGGALTFSCNSLTTFNGADQGRYYPFSVVNGVNYTFATCGTFDTRVYARVDNSGGTPVFDQDFDNNNCGGSANNENVSYTATYTGTLAVAYHFWICGTWNGTSAALQYSQNTTVTNTTSTASICVGSTKNLTAVLGGPHNNPAIVWSKVSGPGTVSGSTYTANGGPGTVTVRATVGVCTSDVTFNVDANSALGSVSNPGPIDFCDAGGNFGTAVTVTGQTGTITWDWGSNNGVWNLGWVTGANSGVCCFPKKTSNSDGNADRMRYRVSNGACPELTSDTILVRNRFNEAPTSLSSNQNNYCSNAPPANLTLTATFPSNINMNGTVAFYSGSCGGTLLGTVTPSALSNTASLVIAAPLTTTTYYARYEPGTGTGCSNTTCVQTTVNVLTPSTAPTAISGVTNICVGGSTTLSVSGGSLGSGANWQWYSGSCGGTPVGSGSSIVVSPASTTTYFVRAEGTCNTTPCAPSATVDVSPDPTISIASSQTICTGGSVTLNSTVSGGTGTCTIQWQSSLDNVSFSNVTTGPSLVTGPLSTTTYYRAIYSCTGSGCDPQTSNTVTITVVPNPTISISGATTICSGGSAALTSSTSGGTGTCTISWFSSPDNSTWTNTGFTGASYTPTGITASTYYQARINCTGINCSQGVSNSVLITVAPDPSITITPSQTICTGGSVTLDATTAGGAGTCGISWESSPDNVNWSPAGSGASFITGSLTATTYYRATYSCSGSGCNPVTSSTSTVTVVSDPSITITPSQTVCSGTGILLNATVTGGTGTGTYQWQVFSGGVWNDVGTNANNYTTPVLTSTTQYRCIFTPSVTGCDPDTSAVTTLTVVPNPTITIGTAQTICSGGSVTLFSSVSGGTGTFTYQWQYFDGIAWQNVGTNSPSYTTGPLTATTDFRCLFSASGLGCTQATSNTVTITVVPDPSITITGAATFCASGSNTLTATASGGTGTFIYQWQQSTDSVNWINVGTNSPSHNTGTLSVTTYFRAIYTASGIGCDEDTSNVITITIEPAIGNNTVSPTYQRFCASGTPSLITGGLPTGGNGTYTYLWQQSVNNGVTWSPASGVNNSIDYQPPFTTSGIWYRRVVTSGTCSDDNNLSMVNILPLPSITNVSTTNVSCFGGNNGTISVSGTSANGGVLYSLNGGPYQPSPFTGLTAGAYTLTIRDDSLCTNTYNANPVVITEPPLLVATITSSTDASCANVFDGSITGVATGGVSPYQYSLNGGPFQIGNTFNGIASGFYTFTAIDANGCLASDTVTINNQYAVTATLDSVKNVSCFGGNDGEIYVTLSGGIMPYSYSINGITFQPLPYFTGLTANNYVVTLRDSKGCSAFLNVTVTQPPLLSVLIDSVANALCAGSSTGGIFITTAGGTPPYSYLWTNGSTNEDLTNVVAGTYNVTITDTKGCIAVGGATISQPLPLFVNVASYQDVLCNGGTSGFVDISVAGGTPPYSFNWSNGVTSEDILNVPTGNYTVTVTDNNGCSQVVSQFINEPPFLTSIYTSVNVICFGGNNGSIDLTVTGGIPPYSFLWSNGQTTEDISGLTAGLYTVVVTDFNGCSTSNTVTIAQPADISISPTITHALCNGGTGTVTLTVTGGTGGYTFSWSNGGSGSSITATAGTYTVTVTDGNGCSKTASYSITQPTAIVVNASIVHVNCFGGNTGSISLNVNGGTFPYSFAWSNGATSQNISGLTGGNYTVTITDANGCTFSNTYTVNAPSSGLATAMSGTNLNCNGDGNGTASVSVAGGTPPYSYNWSTFANTSSISNLNGGTYFVTVTDVNGCTARDSIIITEPAAIQISGTVTNALCNGASGTVTLTVTGGTGGYTFSWSNGGSGSSITATAGTYSVTVTDGNGCSKTASYSITQPTAIVVNASIVHVNCFGGNTGSISLNVNGGTFPYTFAWSNGATSQNISGLTGGNYTVTITDANGCTFSNTYTVNAPSSGLATAMSGTNLNCNGDGNGTASVSVTGGTPPYSYNWSTFANTSSISNLNGGTYFVTVTDVNGCTARDSIIIIEPAAIQISGTVTNALCNGASGTVTLTVTGGTGGYTFSWSNGGSGSSITATAGTYSVTVTDGNGCSKTASYSITQPTAIVVNASIVHVNCFGGNTGSISLNVNGGTFPYSFAWSNGAASQNISGLTGGNYTVTITDANGCTFSNTYTVNAPTTGLATAMSGTNLNCNGDGNGTASVSVTGGTPPYSYNWSTFANTSSISNLNGGTYFVTVTDVNGCTARDSSIIIEPAAIQISGAVTNALCNGASGTVTLTVTGGTGGYSFNWSNGGSGSSITATAGTYTVTVTDGNGCSKTASYSITQPTAIVVNASIVHVNCFGGNTGSISLNVNGGTFPYSFAWSNGAASQNISGLTGGNYTVTITDTNGCTFSNTYTVNAPSSGLATTMSGTNLNCNGDGNGTASVSVTGGTPPYSYNWSTFANTSSISNLNGGTYFVTVTDVNGCTARDSIIITEPAAIQISGTVTNALCNGASGTVTLTVTGGTGGYTFSWSNGGSGSSITATAGTYTVTVTDGNGCSKTASYSITQPTAIVVNASIVHVNCFGGNTGSISLNVNGGTFPYSFAWSNGATSQNISGLTGGNYTVTITDANGCTFSNTYTVNAPSSGLATAMSGTNLNCNGDGNGTASVSVAGGTPPYSYNWSTFANTSSISNLNGGTYFVTVTDVNGCTARDSIIITEPAAIQISGTVTNALCNGASGTVTLTVTGGTGGYTFSWSNGGSGSSITATAGTYSVTVTDGNGCSKTASYTITQPTAIVVNASIVHVNCFGGNTGSISLNVNGGTFPYSFAWSNGATSQNISGLTGGNYTVTITDANGCTFSNTYTVNAPSSGLATTMSGTNLNCNGDGNGTASVSVTGGTPPYSYNWSTFANTSSISNLNGGTYFVTVTDVNGCTARDSIIITEPAAIQISGTVTNALCNGASGTVTLTVTGGTGGYTFSWSNGGSGSSITATAGTYSVTVTDGNGCSKTASYSITQPTAIVVNASIVHVNCFGGNTGSISLNVNGGTFPYSFAWSNGATSQNISGLTGGNYTVTITDTNGCTFSNTYTVNAPSSGLATAMSGTNLNCNGDGNGTASVSVTGGTPPYSYNWSNFANTSSISNLNGGTYFVTVTDVNGCTARDSIIITEPAAIQISGTVTNALCNGASGTVTLTVTGGTGGYTFSWSNGGSGSSITATAGTYTVTVTDGNGCSKTASYSITQPTAIVVNASIVHVNCFGGNTGSISLNVNGGTFPYSFAWSNGAASQNISGLTGGNYTVTITDTNGCTFSNTYTVNAPSSGLATTMSGTNLNCNGDGNGTASVSVTGGTPPYSYNWSTFANTSSISNLNGGTYFVTVTDVNGCIARDSIIITEPAAIQISGTVTNALCNGASGTVTLTVTGGTGGYTFSWSNGGSGSSITATAGTYTVTVTDGNGCSKTASYSITQPTAIVVNASIVHVNCFGGNTGSISLNVNGGTFPYSFAWSNGATSQNISGLTGGNYTVTITDANGCTFSNTYTVNAPSSGLATAMSGTNLNCNGDGNGTASVSVTGGTPPYSYNWSTFANTSSISNLNGGTYFVTVTDVNGCIARDSIIITEPAAIQISGTVTNALCNGASGTVTLTVTGGTGGYTFSWSNGGSGSSITATAGTYTVTVTDGNGCSKTASYSITQPTAIVVNASIVHVNCFGGNTGSISLNVNGGTFPYSFAWSNGATSQNISGLTGGNYTVTITDANGCTFSNTYTVNAPSSGLATTMSGTNPLCHNNSNGTASVSVTGGILPYSYNWSTFANTSSISNLNGGTYFVTVTDVNGCTARDSIILVNPAPITLTPTIVNALCNGLNGSITLSVSGGTGTYVYTWSNGGNSNTISDTAGIYTVTVTDGNNCSSVNTYTITQPDTVSVTANVINSNCDGSNPGSIALNVSGGTAPYSYTWSNGGTSASISGLLAGTYNVTITDFNGCTKTASYSISQTNGFAISGVVNPILCGGSSSGSIVTSVTNATFPVIYSWSTGDTTPNLFGLTPGTYSVTATDAAGCIAVASFNITAPAALTVILDSLNDANCALSQSGSIYVSVSGGTIPYTYIWSNGVTTQDITGLTGGTYILIVTDNKGCTQIASFSVNDPTAPFATALVTSPACFGNANGSIDVTTTGGNPPYSFFWNNGATTEDLTSIAAGLFNLTITDQSGCVYQLGVNVTQPNPISLNFNAIDGNCIGATGSASVVAFGGTPPYSYLWSNSANTASISGLTAGTYAVTVTDFNGCTASGFVNISQAGSLDIQATVSNAGCFGTGTGSIFTNTFGGTLPYSYAWSNGAATPNLVNVAAGVYTVSVTDAQGCIRVKSFTVGGNTQILVSGTVSDADCSNNILGSIATTTTGGTSPYSYLWLFNGTTTPNVSNLIAGNYVVIVQDNQGCTTAKTFVVNEASGFSVSGSANNISCNGANDGSITITITGGVGPYAFLWNDNATTQNRSALSAGYYTITVTDIGNNNCQFLSSFIINEPSPIALTNINTNANCFGAPTGIIDLVVNGGSAPYSFIWSNGFTTEDLVGVSGGVYSVTVTDAFGCSKSGTFVLGQPAAINVAASINNPNCFNGTNGSIFLNVTGGLAPYTFAWNTGDSTPSIINLSQNTYTVTVTDANNCSVVKSYSITAPAPVVATATGTDADCANNILGSIDASVSGGIPPYTYLWNNFATTQDLSNLYAGTYVLTVTDALGCTGMVSYTVNDISNNISVSEVVTDASCPGSADGAIDVTVSGGTFPYTFIWSNGATTEDIAGLAAGNYALTIIDGAGCGFFKGFTVDSPDSISIAANITDATCGGGPDGAIDLTVSGGVGAPYAFQWSNGANTEDLNLLAAGTYTVTVTDGGGCQQSQSFNVSAGGTLVVTAAVNNVSCTNGSNGNIFLTVSGGTPPYTYLWSNGATTAALLNVPQGSYNVSVTDAGGCIKIQTINVTQPVPLQIVNPVITNVLCFGLNTGAIDITVIGGTGNRTYLWSSSETTEDLSGKTAGLYSVVVTDANGCSATGAFTIAQPADLTIASTVTNALCNGASGTVTLTVTGGTGGYTFSWSNGGSGSSITATAGTYTVTVTDGNGCSKTASYSITQPTAIVVNASIVHVNCFGGNTGSISLNVNGGTFPYSFAWSNGATSQNISGLTGGNYTVTITDANGCTFSNTYTVNAPSSGLATAMSGTNLNCNGDGNGTASVSVAGGTPPYSYNWSTFANTSSISNLNGGTYFVTVTDVNGCTARDSIIITEPAAIQISGTVTNALCNGASGTVTLTVTGGTGGYTFSWSNGGSGSSITATAGTYSVTVTDGNGCSKTASYSITQPTAIVVNASIVHVNCFGGNTGSISLNVNGGTFPYTFAWSNGATSQNISGLTGGNYTVTITDANGCTFSNTYTVNAPSSGLATAMSGTNLNCNGDGNGTASVSVTGGTPPYSYNWSTFANTSSISNLNGGTYFVTVTDVNGCTARDSIIIIEPAAIQISGTVTNALCNGASGTVTLTVTGGTGGYTFSWSNGGSGSSITATAGTYSVTVTDGNGCSKTASYSITQPTAIVVNASIVHVNCFGGNTGSISLNVNGGTFPYSFAWSNGAASQNISGLTGGNYTVTITDANGCTFSNTYTVNAPTTGLATAMSGTNLNCNGDGNGTASVSVTGGTPPYSYNWSTFANTSSISNLNGGTYFVTVTDINGCTARDSSIIIEPAAIQISGAVTNALCNGASGTVTLTVTGGTGGYSFNWSNGGSGSSITATAGTYTVTVTDGNGCSKTASYTISQPTAIQVSGVVKNVSCAGASDGSVTQSIFGGVQPYNFAWSNGATTQNVNGLSGNTYTFTVTDFNGCIATASYIVVEPQPLTAVITKTDVNCPGAANGSATVTVNGGTQPYTYFWSNFAIGQSINGLSGGTYYVIVKDKNNCELRDSVLIAEPQPIVITPTIFNVSCNGGNNGAVFVTVTGGTPNYNYAWSNGATNDTVIGLTSGQYTLTVTDANSCTQVISINITQPVGLSLTGVAVDVLCNGSTNGKVDITVVGGTVPYSFAWSNGSTSEDLNNVGAGNYEVTVTDFAGCTTTASYNVSEPTPIITQVSSTNVTCFNAKNGTASVTVSGGTAPYTYLWSTFQGSANISNLNGGLYIVIVTDKNGCEKRDSANIFEPQPLSLTTTVNQISCFNANNGSITVNVTGGTPTYTFAWSNGATSPALTGLAGGIYEVTVTDIQNCTVVTSAQIINPSQLNINALVKTPKCSGDSNGSIDLIVSGGTPVYTFNWSNGDTIEDPANLSSGIYIITVTDSKGCTARDTIDVTQPSPLYQTGIVTDVSCAGASDGVIINTAYGGTLPYIYQWNDGSVNKDRGNLSGGTYRVTVTDGNGCTAQGVYNIFEPLPLTISLVKKDANCFGSSTGSVAVVVSGGTYPYYYLWSNFEIDSALNNLKAGKYAVVVTDKNNCRITDSITIHQNTQILISGTVVDAKCKGIADGQVSITVSGGTGNYVFLWSNGVTSQNLSNVAAGTYTVTVTDGSQCTAVASFTVGEKTKLSTNMSVSNPICSGGNTGFASVVVTGGAEPYTYSWNTTPLQTGATATQLPAGIYVVTITDSYGCVTTDTARLIQPAVIKVSTNTIGSKCSNTATGKVTATVTGGTAPYVYILNNITQSSNEFVGLLPGTYTLLVRDVNGCEGTATFTISSPNTISVSLVSDKQIILAGMEAQLSAITNSTKAVISHVWTPVGTFNFTDCADSNNCSNPKVAPLSTTTYAVLVMDEDSCTASDTVTVVVAISQSSFIPTAFTPNGDGLNDRFEFDILGAVDAHVRVYDRWGNLIYENDRQLNGIDRGEGWDGTFKGAPVQLDTYVYMMKVRYFNGVEKEITGTISVMK